jgi:hypothetical protein
VGSAGSDRDHAHCGGLRGPDPVRRVLDGRDSLRRGAEAASRFEVDIRGRLPAGDLLGRDGRAEEVGDAELADDEVDERAVGRRGHGERPAGADPSHGLDGPAHEREALAIPFLHPLDDDPVQLLRRAGHAELLVEVARPLW